MTIFGPDISNYEAGLDLARLAAAAFVFAKATEGTYYTDRSYQGWREQAPALGLPFAWYHFLSGESAAAQARHTVAVVGSTVLPGMLDAEPQDQTKFRPTMAQIIGYIDAAHAAGLNLRLLYLPRWYWQELGSPDLTPVGQRGVFLVSSAYPGGTGRPAAIYPGDKAPGWAPYGGLTPLIYQFTNQASDGGRVMDYNAYRGGTASDLALQLRPPTAAPAPNPSPTPNPTPTPISMEDDDMPVCVTGEVKPGTEAVTMVCPPPANSGTAGWGAVWFSLGCDFGDVTVRCAAYVAGVGWDIKEGVVVTHDGPRVNPWGGPLPTGVQKISIVRESGPDVPCAWLIEAAHR